MAGRLWALPLAFVVYVLLGLAVPATTERAEGGQPPPRSRDDGARPGAISKLVPTEAPTWSRDGNWLLIPAEERSSGAQRLLLAKRAGLSVEVSRGFALRHRARSVQWSEGAGQAVFQSSDGTAVISVLDLKNGEIQQFAEGAAPAISSAGIAVFARRDQDGVNIYSLEFGSRRVTKLTSGMLARDWCISPNGKWVAVRYGTLDAKAPQVQRPLAVVSVANPLAVMNVDPGAGYADFGMAWRSDDALLFGVVGEEAGGHRFEVVEFSMSSQARRVVLKSREFDWYTGRPWWSARGEYVVYPSATRSKGGSPRENWQALKRLNTVSGEISGINFRTALKANLSLSRDGALVAAISENGELWLGSFALGKAAKCVPTAHTKPAEARPAR